MTYTTILHPTDFSASAERALEVAVRFAAAHKAGLLILHGELLHEASPVDVNSKLEECVESARRPLGQLSTNGPSIVEAIHDRAVRADELILELAEDRDVDLIVMGTHGRRGLSRLFMGSTAEHVLRKAACHVLTVRADAAVPEAGRLRKVLVPTDFSGHSQQGLAVAAALAADWNAEVHLLHVFELPSSAAYADYVSIPSELHEDLRAHLQEKLTAFAQGFPVARCLVAEGHPAAEIARLADDEAMDLIVMSAVGAGSVAWLPVGSTTARVVRIAGKPVLAVR